MADFILPINEQGDVKLRFNGGAENDGITYRAHRAYEDVATVTAAGHITPARLGSMLIEVIDAADGSVIGELAGAIVSEARFDRLKSIRRGDLRQDLKVHGTVTNVHLGPGLFGAVISG